MRSEPLILCLETSSTVCSAALTLPRDVVGSVELDAGYSHAENLHVFIRELLKSSDLSAKDIAAVAISAGPGSYTGLRIGSSTAKGLCFALQVPLIAISTLQSLAWAMREKQRSHYYGPMLDAGRMEVYTALYDSELQEITPVRPFILDQEDPNSLIVDPQTAFAGPGAEKAREILSAVGSGIVIAGIKPSALHLQALAHIAYKNLDFRDISSYEPFYLKNFIAGKKKKAP